MEDKNDFLKKSLKSVADSRNNFLEQIKNGMQKISDIGINTKKQAINYVKDIFDILPLIEEAGFRTNRLEVGISVPPSIEIHFSRFKELDKESIERLYTENNDKKMFKLILKSLITSNDFQSKLSTDDLIFSETCIEISIPPKVKIRYLNKNSANLVKLEPPIIDANSNG